MFFFSRLLLDAAGTVWFVTMTHGIMGFAFQGSVPKGQVKVFYMDDINTIYPPAF